MLAGINFLNGRKADGSCKPCGTHRPDLDGMPFAMGDACRTRASAAVNSRWRSERSASASGAAAAPDPATGQPAGDRDRAPPSGTSTGACAEQDRGASQIDRARARTSPRPASRP